MLEICGGAGPRWHPLDTSVVTPWIRLYPLDTSVAPPGYVCGWHPLDTSVQNEKERAVLT